METNGEDLWTIEELRAKAAEALSGAGYSGVASGRVRDVPDQRTIRYYSTLGLLDRPSGARGRVALYGSRHLRQIVAIKTLQSGGKSLAEIQQAVAGASDSELASLGGRLDRASPRPTSEARMPRPLRSETFWREPSSAPPPPVVIETPPVVTLQATRLGPDVTLLLNTVRPIDEDDLGVIRMAAAPLIELLRLRGLIGPNGDSRVAGVHSSPSASPVPARDDRGTLSQKEAP